MADTSELMGRIQALLKEHLGLDPEQLKPDQALAELGVESLSMVEFMFELETEFNVNFSNEGEMPRTVADLTAAVEKAIADKEAGKA